MNKPKVEITKTVEVVNDVEKAPTWVIALKKSDRSSFDYLHRLSLQDIEVLRDALNNLKI